MTATDDEKRDDDDDNDNDDDDMVIKTSVNVKMKSDGTMIDGR